MASFLDNPQNTRFTPYIPVNPVDSMLQVGITKQQQYEQGLQKVQGYVDSLNGFDISKPEIKQYVQAKLQELHQNVNNVSGDFSDQRLVNQIGGAASKIANDPVVRNGLMATSNIRAGYQQIEDSRKKGESNPANEWVFQDSVNKWMSDGQYDTQFSGSYTPYVDVVKKVRETFKDMNAGQDLLGDTVRIDNDGKITYNPAIPEGISAKRVQDAIDLVYQDPAVQNQLAISGQYKFRGMDGKQMFDQIVGDTQSSLGRINEAILSAQAKMGMSTEVGKQALQNEIATLKNQAENTISTSKNYIDGLSRSVDGVKSQYLGDHMRADMVGTFAYQKLVQNPLWNAQMEERKFNLQEREFKYKQQYDAERLLIDKEDLAIKREKEAREKADKAGGQSFLGLNPVAQSQGEKSSATMYEQRDTLLNKFLDTNKGAINNFATVSKANQPYKKLTDGTWVLNVGEGGYSTKEEANTASQKLVAEARNQYSHGTASDSVISDVEAIDKAWDDYNSVDQKIKNLETGLKPQIEQINQAIGGKYNSDWFDAYIVKYGLAGADASKKRLEGKFGPSWEKALGIGIYGFGENAEKFKEFSNKIKKNKELLNVTQSIEDRFKNAQAAYQDKAVFFNAVKDDQLTEAGNAFVASINAQSVIPGTGDADELLKMMQSSDKGSKDNRFFAYTSYDKAGNKVSHLGITRPGGDTKEVVIPYDVFVANFNRPGLSAVADDQFNQTYGVRLAINGGDNTFASPNDNNIQNGRTSAYHQKTAGGEYNIQYHLFRDASNSGQYKIRMWITNTSDGKTLVDGQEYAPKGVGRSMTPAQIQAQLEILKNPAAVQAYLSEYAK